MKNCRICLYFFVVLLYTACGQKKDNTIKEEVTTSISAEKIVDDTKNTWGMDFLPDGAIIYTEKEGELIIFKDGTKTSVAGLPEIQLKGQGGLMDVTLHPNFKENKLIYFSYPSDEGEGEGINTAVMRAELQGNQLANQQVIYKASPNSKKAYHFGSRIIFDDAGYLYFSIGDRGSRDENPQDIAKDGGKIYRLNDDGSIPDDNPFVDEEGAKKGGLELWSPKSARIN